MDKSQVLEKAMQYAALVSDKIKLQKVVLYGSYARGNWKEESDIDIAVVVDTVAGDFLETEAMLYKLRRGIDDRIEPVLFEEENDESGFLSEILKYGQVIYSI
jgi:predicted nucleotidyltransferase